MLPKTLFLRALAFAGVVNAAPLAPRGSSNLSCDLSDPNCGPVPGESNIYNNYTGTTPPFPANSLAPINATSNGPPGPDDLLFQNLLSAEWIVYSFYQTGVELFNESSFTSIGRPNTTYERIVQIRDNEAGHLRIFQDSISANSLKPGACKYDFGQIDAETFLAYQLIIEIGSEAFLTGLAMEARQNATKGALAAIAEVESRHDTWGLIENWGANPFVGPSDTVFPYANQILDKLNGYVVPGSCPAENPSWPLPNQRLPQVGLAPNITSASPGDEIVLTFTATPAYQPDTPYYAVFYHGVETVSMPFDASTNITTVPGQFDHMGLIIMVIADQENAPTADSVVAGPLLLLEQPGDLAIPLS